MGERLLTVRDLRVSYAGPDGPAPALHDICFDVGRERVGIVGESGSGKSTVGRAIMRLLPAGAKVSARELRFGDVDLSRASERAMRRVRGARIAMILQDPRHALNPLQTVGAQIAEAYAIHRPEGRRRARSRALEMLESVSIRDPERVYGLYPHEVSGGMGQRVMIAMMLAPDPELVIADEPTSALDVTVRRSVLDTLDALVTRRRAGVILISHDLPLVAAYCDRILVMYRGRIVEELASADLATARHPYTRALIESLPPLDSKVARLVVPPRDPAWAESLSAGDPGR
jgi:peptide/nickel transport system ATP-binding protein